MNDSLIIRCARPDDLRRVRRLAALDSARAPRGAVLLAEVEGQLRAALSVDEGTAVADPFFRSLELVALLKVRAGQMRLGAGEGAWGTTARPRVALRVAGSPRVG